MPTHCMLDLETLGNSSTAAIATLGAIVFDPDGADVPIPGGTHEPGTGHFYRLVDLESSVKAGLRIDTSTVLWWLQQAESARHEIVRAPRVPLGTALVELSEFLSRHGVSRVWSHGATFDIVILSNAYGLFNGHVGGVPWRYDAARDTRTIYDLAGIDLKAMPTPEGLPLHHALGDAWRQAVAVQRAYRKLGLAANVEVPT